MKILTLGNGFVANHLPYEKILERVPTDILLIRDLLNKYKPDCLINCIGFCGVPNIDQCEVEKEKTIVTNTIIPILLATECEKLGIHLIHIGSGCIYFGESPNYYLERHGDPHYNTDTVDSVDGGWKETDFANPKSFYSCSKYSADLAMASFKSTAILRIRMPISTKNDPRNFINKIRGYKQLIDIPNSVTFMDDLVRCIDWVAKEHKTGLFHVTNPEPLSAAQVMQEYQKYVPEHTFEIIDEKQLDNLTIAKRSNCIINSDKLRKTGFKMTDSKEALANCMALYMKNI